MVWRTIPKMFYTIRKISAFIFFDENVLCFSSHAISKMKCLLGRCDNGKTEVRLEWLEHIRQKTNKRGYNKKTPNNCKYNLILIWEPSFARDVSNERWQTENQPKKIFSYLRRIKLWRLRLLQNLEVKNSGKYSKWDKHNKNITCYS